MNPNIKRWMIRLSVLFLVGLAALFWSLSGRGRNLTIENRSEQTIDELKITIAGQIKTFQNVKSGAEVSASCPASGSEFPYTVEGKLSDGKIFRSTGQIQDGLHFLLIPGGQLERRPKKWFE
jgi:hypothetical protein